MTQTKIDYKSKKIILPTLNIPATKSSIQNFIINQTTGNGNNWTGAVIGLSGGIDSTLTAILANEAYSEYNKQSGTNLQLKGYILPTKINHTSDKKDAKYLADQLGIEVETINIQPEVDRLKQRQPKFQNNPYHLGNAISRIRANILHDESSLENKLVIGTGNQDEDFGVGYYTLFGDGAVMASPIGDLSKRHVRELIQTYKQFKQFANKTPTAGLEQNQTDFNDLGYSYQTAELLLEGIRQGIPQSELHTNTQIQNQIQTELTQSKFNHTNEVIDDFLKRHQLAQKKSKLISPPIAHAIKHYN